MVLLQICHVDFSFTKIDMHIAPLIAITVLQTFFLTVSIANTQYNFLMLDFLIVFIVYFDIIQL